MFQRGNDPNRHRQVPPPINVQTDPTSMRQGRVLSPPGGTPLGDVDGGGGGHHSTSTALPPQRWRKHGSSRHAAAVASALSPTSQVRFQEETVAKNHPKRPKEHNSKRSHSPTFLFERGEWNDSEDEEDYNNIELVDDNDTDSRDCGEGTRTGPTATTPATIPSEAQLCLLCLDYLRELRRSYQHKYDLLNAEGLDADCITLAAWSLSRAFVRPQKLKHSNNHGASSANKVSVVVEVASKGSKVSSRARVETKYYGGGGLGGGLLDDGPVGNDAWYRQLDDDFVVSETKEEEDLFILSESLRLPTMDGITKEVLLCHPNEHGDDEPFYEHNDAHTSNSHRFYLLNGLASEASSAIVEGLPSPTSNGGSLAPLFPAARSATSHNAGMTSGAPLSFGEIVVAGLASLRARPRIEAEKEMVLENPLFLQFVEAASAGGFFQEKRSDHLRGSSTRHQCLPTSKGGAVTSALAPDKEELLSRLLYEEKYRKIVNKFRTKLASKEAQMLQPSSYCPTLSPKYNHPPTTSPSRIRSAYKTMSYSIHHSRDNGSISGNLSVAGSQDEGRGLSSNLGAVMNAVAQNRNVAKRLSQRRERRMERVKDKRGNAPMKEEDKQLGQQFRNREQQLHSSCGAGSVLAVPNTSCSSVVQDQTMQHQKVKDSTQQQSQRTRVLNEQTTPQATTSANADKKTSSLFSSPTTASSTVNSAVAAASSPLSLTASLSLPSHYEEAECLNVLGNTQMQSRSFHAALATYTSALELMSSSLGAPNNNSHVYYSNRSAAHLGLNDYVASIEDSHKSLALQPKYAKAQLRLGLAYFAKGAYEEAVASYEKALAMEGGDNEWGRVHLEKARARLKMRMETSDDGARVNNVGARKELETEEKGEILDEKVNEQKKERDGTRINEEDSWLSPFEEKSHAGYAANDEGAANIPLKEQKTNEEEEAKQEDGETEKEEGDAQDDQIEELRVKEIEEQNVNKQACQADDHKDRGNAHMSKKEYEEALLQYNAAISTSPTGPNSHVYYSNRAAAYCYLAEYNLASDDCRSAIVLHPTYEKAHARLGLSLFFLKDYAGSVSAYRKSLELDPENKASLSYLKKAEALWEDQKRSKEDEKKKEVEQEREGQLRRRREWLEKRQIQHQQSQYYQRQQQHRYSKHPDPRLRIDEEDEEDDEESSLGNSTGLSSIATNVNDIKKEHEEPAVVGDDQEMSLTEAEYQEAFDPFSVTDDEC